MAIKELHIIKSIPRKYIKPWLAKQALWQFHIPPPKKIYHQFDLLHMSHYVFEGNTYKYTLMLHQDIKSPGPLEPKNQARLHLCWKQSKRRVAYLSTQKYFTVIMDLSLQMKWQSCLKNTMLIFEEQQQNSSIIIRPLWKPLTRSWQNVVSTDGFSTASGTWKNINNLGYKFE